jgi:hypothetical protein
MLNAIVPPNGLVVVVGVLHFGWEDELELS